MVVIKCPGGSRPTSFCHHALSCVHAASGHTSVALCQVLHYEIMGALVSMIMGKFKKDARIVVSSRG